MTAMVIVVRIVIRLLTVPMGAVAIIVPWRVLGTVVMAKAESMRQVASGQKQGCRDQQYTAVQTPSKGRFFGRKIE